MAAALAAGVEEYDEEKLRQNLERAEQLVRSLCHCKSPGMSHSRARWAHACMATQGVQENVDKAYEMLCALITEKQWLYDNAAYQLQVRSVRGCVCRCVCFSVTISQGCGRSGAGRRTNA